MNDNNGEETTLERRHYCHRCGQGLTEKHVDGRQRRYCEYCQRPVYDNPVPATCLVVLHEKKRLLLVKRSVTPKKGWWCLPGGFVEVDESPAAGALRELKEETGLIGEDPVLLGVMTTPGSQYQAILMIGYRVPRFSGNEMAGDDAEALAWFAPTDLPPVAFDSHQQFIGQVLNSDDS